MKRKLSQYQAEAEIVAVNERDLPKRLGLLLRNGEGKERWFSWWNDGKGFHDLREGDRVRITYCLKPSKQKDGEPFLNILDLEVLGGKGEGEAELPKEGAERGRGATETEAEDGLEDYLLQELRQRVAIRVAVAAKAAASWGWAKDMEDFELLANAIYRWLAKKEEEELQKEVQKILGEEVKAEG